MKDIYVYITLYKMKKKCVKCLIIKTIGDFYKNKGGKDGHYNVCKICKLGTGKKWEINNREKRLQDKKDNYHTTKDQRRKQQKIWNENNKERLNAYYKNYRVDNREKIRKYREDNREELLAYHRTYQKKFRKKYPHKCIWYDIIRRSLRGYILKPSDNKKKIELLKYTPEQLKQRIETQFTDGMTWENYGEWHIDHKKPVSRFTENTPIHIVNCLCNLQPLWAIDNLKKGNKFYVKK